MHVYPFLLHVHPLRDPLGPARLGPSGGPPEAWLVLEFSLGVRISPGHIFREGGVHVGNRDVRASLARNKGPRSLV